MESLKTITWIVSGLAAFGVTALLAYLLDLLQKRFAAFDVVVDYTPTGCLVILLLVLVFFPLHMGINTLLYGAIAG